MIIDEKHEPYRWQWWYVAAGSWTDCSEPLEWLTGDIEGMVAEYGGYSKAPMLVYDGKAQVCVFQLYDRTFSSAQRVQLVEAQTADADEYLRTLEQWDADKNPLEWLDRFEAVYPSSHLVYVHYPESRRYIEVHGIFCRSYPDLLQVLLRVNL